MKIESVHFAKFPAYKAKKNGKKTAIAYRDNSLSKWIDISWSEFYERVSLVARAIASLGISEQDNVGICAQNMPQGLIADFANFANRVVSVPIYATSSVGQIEYIVNDAQLQLLFVGEQEQYDKAIEARKNCGVLKNIVVFDDSVDLRGEENVYLFGNFMNLDADAKFEKEVKKRTEAAKDEDLAVIMYTSGTTGEPKGVMLLHTALLEAMRIHDIALYKVNKRDRSLAFLPMTHIFERAWVYFCFYEDVTVYLNQHPVEIQKIIKEVRPTLMCSVPRFWEKIGAGVQEKIATFSPMKKGLVTWALAVGKEYNIDYRRVNRRAPLGLYLRYKFADRAIFSTLKKVIGIEKGRLFPVAGAALDDKLLMFFLSMGIPVKYGYGLTETTATVSCFDYENYRIGSVGKVMPDVQVKISDEDEILVKGKTVFVGYYNKPEATAEALKDGWFHTGDKGKLEGDQLYMSERLKDLFKTSNGKYIAPQQIETILGADRHIEQIAVIGNNRNYVTAIVAPNLETVKNIADEKGLKYDNIRELMTNPDVVKFYEEIIAKGQVDMASYEKIKKFRLINPAFTIEAGELTSTLKLRRAIILQNYATLIDEMYETVQSPGGYHY
ncbi:MAG: long-chain fatty acid--CoA ligase [bacterium]